jgi:hypothetical protein
MYAHASAHALSRLELKEIYETCYNPEEIPDVHKPPDWLCLPIFVKQVHTTNTWYIFDQLGTKTYLMQAVVICPQCGMQHYAMEYCHSKCYDIVILSRWIRDTGYEWARIITEDGAFITGIPCITDQSAMSLGYCFYYNNKYYVINQGILFRAEEESAKWLHGHYIWKDDLSLNLNLKYADCYGNIYDCKLYHNANDEFYIILDNLQEGQSIHSQICITYICQKIARKLYNKLLYVNNAEIVPWKERASIKAKAQTNNIAIMPIHIFYHNDIPITTLTFSLNRFNVKSNDAGIIAIAKKAVLQVIVSHFFNGKQYFINYIKYDHEIQDIPGYLPFSIISITTSLKTACGKIREDTKRFSIPYCHSNIIALIARAARYSAVSIIYNAKDCAEKAIEIIWKKANYNNRIKIFDHSIGITHNINEKNYLTALVSLSAKICIQTETLSMTFSVIKHRSNCNKEDIFKKSYIECAMIISDTAITAAILAAEDIINDKQIINIRTGVSLAKSDYDIIALITIIKLLHDTKCKNLFYVKSAIDITVKKKNVIIKIMIVLMKDINVIVDEQTHVMRGNKGIMDYIQEKTKAVIHKYI